ncbi:hypothetical protein FJ941_11030 [Mesorhizobium sp. B2-3-13]|nr:hypothetical protein FJ432_06625 [Mesorhizobium sp. B2-6-5]TPJ93719.1 hypothetical protein FJ434_00570 [Mesorhizobium sp. B2-5-13]TPK47192.1 hypothetical protein FJ560_17720 [Mesorhizobium sp. B2-5-5]TPL83866.1 hypothetical protein FJ941_11030 [Mesorhizobium sp. B2-3-13]
METAVRRSLGFSLAYFAFACSIAAACAGTAAAGPHGGGHDGGGHQGDNGGHGSHDNGGNGKGKGKGPAGDPGDPVGNSGSPPSTNDGISTTPTASIPSTPADIVDRSTDGGHSLDLPPALQPLEDNTVLSAVHPIEALPGVPDKVVRACQDAIEQAAAKFGAASVRVSSAGSIRRLSQRKISAPVQVSIDYMHQGRVETRQAPVGCELNAKGSVIGLT